MEIGGAPDLHVQAAWDREQEIVDEAGGGELVFADALVTYWDKIVITDPAWRPDPEWQVEGGFDHGKTNPTSLDRMYIDFNGGLIFDASAVGNGKQRKTRSADREPHDYCGRPVLSRMALWRGSGLKGSYTGAPLHR